MKFAAALVTAGALATSASAAAAGKQKTYRLKTQVVDGYDVFNNLYLSPSHSGAGFNDALLLPNKTNAAVGYLVKTNSTPADGHNFYLQQFQLNPSDTTPYELVVDIGVNTYAAWTPTGINAGGIKPNGNSPNSGFWINGTGLQWTDSPAYPTSTSSFDGWLVCQWWRGAPQLFSRVKVIAEETTTPDTCAVVNLIPEYIH